MRRITVLASLIGLLGCASSDPFGPNFVERLTTFGGCADILFYAVDSGDELMLSFTAEGVLAEARSAGEGETVMIFDLPTAAARLTLEQGTRVSDVTCDDVMENGGPNVSRTWTAISGTATLNLRPEAGRETGSADLLLEHVVLDGDGGERVTLERLEWTDILVGWYAGRDR